VLGQASAARTRQVETDIFRTPSPSLRHAMALTCRRCWAPITVNLYLMPRLILCDACLAHFVSADVVFGVAAALRGHAT